jgi:hypothetical protein
VAAKPAIKDEALISRPLRLVRGFDKNEDVVGKRRPRSESGSVEPLIYAA